MQAASPFKAVFLDYDTVADGDLDCAALAAAVDELTLLAADDAQLPQRLQNATAILLNKTRLSRELLRGAPLLRLIAIAATGTDNVDLQAAHELGIAVCNVRAYCTASVVQHVWSLILSLTQQQRAFSRLAHGGSWGRAEHVFASHPIRELQGLNFGVVGFGALGRGAAQIAAAFGMRVLVAAHGSNGASGASGVTSATRGPGAPDQLDAIGAPGRLPLHALLAQSDIVSLHCPLREATRGLIGARELALMKPTALLINTARGALVDGHALAAALKTGRIAGAGLDVLALEPPAADDPLLARDVPNLLLTPHVAWAAREARQRCIDEMAANIRDFRAGGQRGRVV